MTFNTPYNYGGKDKLYLTTGAFSSTMNTSQPFTAAKKVLCKGCGEEAWLSARGLCTAWCEKNTPNHLPEEQFKRYYEATKTRRIE
jgi:hypothetical protein